MFVEREKHQHRQKSKKKAGKMAGEERLEKPARDLKARGGKCKSMTQSGFGGQCIRGAQ